VTAPATKETGDHVKSTRERAEEKRQAKLEYVREQVESGSLVIRQMTDEERKKNPARPAQPKRFGRR
jgi:hypothetical protein